MTPLRLRMIEDMEIRNLAPLTQKSYIEQVARFARHFDRSPEHLGPDEIRLWLLHLIRDKHLAASSMAVAVAALRFCYTVTLGRAWMVRQPPKASNATPAVGAIIGTTIVAIVTQEIFVRAA